MKYILLKIDLAAPYLSMFPRINNLVYVSAMCIW